MWKCPKNGVQDGKNWVQGGSRKWAEMAKGWWTDTKKGGRALVEKEKCAQNRQKVVKNTLFLAFLGEGEWKRVKKCVFWQYYINAFLCDFGFAKTPFSRFARGSRPATPPKNPRGPLVQVYTHRGFAKIDLFKNRGKIDRENWSELKSWKSRPLKTLYISGLFFFRKPLAAVVQTACPPEKDPT